MAELLGIKAYARHRAVSPAAVRKAIKVGRLKKSITQGQRGALIDAKVADKEWDTKTSQLRKPKKERAASRARAGPKKKAPAAPPSPGKASSPEEDETLHDAQTRERRAKASMAQLQLGEMEEQYVEVSEVRDAIYKEQRAARDACISLPDRIVRLFEEGVTTTAELHALLITEVTRHMKEVCGDG